jgi:hypothetical protein
MRRRYIYCATCQSPTYSIRLTGRYCSNRCRQKAYRNRIRERASGVGAGAPRPSPQGVDMQYRLFGLAPLPVPYPTPEPERNAVQGGCSGTQETDKSGGAP